MGKCFQNNNLIKVSKSVNFEFIISWMYFAKYQFQFVYFWHFVHICYFYQTSNCSWMASRTFKVSVCAPQPFVLPNTWALIATPPQQDCIVLFKSFNCFNCVVTKLSHAVSACFHLFPHLNIICFLDHYS